MKNLFFTVVMFSSMTTFLWAQDVQKTVFYLGGGPSFPITSMFSDCWETGFNVGGGIGYIADRDFTLRGYLDYNRFGFYDSNILNIPGYNISSSRDAINTISLSAEIMTTFPLGDTVKIYFLSGLGYFRISGGKIENGPALFIIPSGDDIFVDFGIGLDFKINKKISFFTEFKYAIGFTYKQSTQYIPLRFGLSFKI